MGLCRPFWFLVVLLALAFEAREVLTRSYEDCQTNSCSHLGPNITYPFFKSGNDFCGYPGFEIECKEDNTTIFAGFVVQSISYGNRSFDVMDKAAVDGFCHPDEPKRQPHIFNTFINRRTNDSMCFFYNCTSLSSPFLKPSENCSSGDSFYGLVPPNYAWEDKTFQCKWFAIFPIDLKEGDRNKSLKLSDYKRLLEDGITLSWSSLLTVSSCDGCQQSGGRCGRSNSGDFVCFCRAGTAHPNDCNQTGSSKWLKRGLGVGVGGLAVVLCLLSCSIYFRKQHATKRSSSGHSSDVEDRCVYFEVPIFTSRELEEATNYFSLSNELGDGAFGKVYYGKLRDGREVAVKRLFEHNNHRVKHFMNEVEILTRLRHENLLTLYGCTSSHSHELLLVYEYVANGTVASHLFGERSIVGRPLPWHIRMSVALQTAQALTFLHASDIIHRDVKTNNILLDKNFNVKVGDFGISRLFPNDVTHVSTTPQGTPGYVDPEYHQCYQLTEKSDVYSFGVVLIELVSSKPAVDLCRDKQEINLANFAISRIERRALDELIDPSLGSESDPEIHRMMASVAELAYWCLQPEKEWRPTMDEVLMELKAIADEGKNNNEGTNINIVRLRESTCPIRAPISVTQKWARRSNASLPLDTKVLQSYTPRHSA